ncbi:MAG: hypothetical protein JJ913_13965 [Rhizobiaceae bacterium]|nr:hypothetical protein [Rhizobiaceae bacterium]
MPDGLQHADRTDAHQGIDLFDFLYEVWRSKWLFVGIALCTGLIALAPALLIGQQRGDTPPNTRQFEIALSFNVANDPAQRGKAGILADILGRALTSIDIEIVHISLSEPPDVVVPNFTTWYSEATEKGNIRVNVSADDTTTVRTFFDALSKASVSQVAETRRQLVVDAEIAKSILSEFDLSDGYYLGRQLFIARRFPTLPGVQEGEFRFLRFGEPREIVREAASDTGRGAAGLLRMLVLAGLVGCVAGFVAVMFRIAIRRRSTAPSA